MSRKTVTALVVVTLAAIAFMVIRPDRPSGELVLWPFTGARISTNNNSVQVTPFVPADNDCYRYSHIETEIDGSQLLVSLYFERLTEFCIVPCPIGKMEPVSANIRPKPTTRLTPVRHPDTPAHCSEGMQ